MHKIEVGKTFSGQVMQEGIVMDYNQNGFTLYFFLPGMTKNEENSFKHGNYRFAITEMAGILFFLSEFKPGIDLSDTPFHIGAYKDNRAKYLPSFIEKGKGLNLSIIAVDSKTAIVKALRNIGLSTMFSRKMIEICLRQSKETISRDEYNEKLQSVFRRYKAKDLYRFKIAECKG